jgi:hypothetical protein
MFQMGLMEVIQAEREREIASVIRTRRLLQQRDGAIDSAPAPVHETNETRRLAVRAARSSGG